MLRQVLEDLSAALARRASSAPARESREQAERLRTHVDSYLLPRASDLAAPLFVVILGSTGSGKSSLFNALARRAVSPSGLLRPTTRQPVALAHPDDSIDIHPDLLVVSDRAAPKGLVIVDSPDFDSVEQHNRQLALDLLEKADLVIFVTTVTRYADQVPWLVLDRARQRGVPLLMVINRMPVDIQDRTEVLADYRELLERGGLDNQGAFGDLEVVSVAEGALDPERDALGAEPISPITSAIEKLRSDDAARRAVARRGLITALEGLPGGVEQIADETEKEQQATAALLEEVDRAYERGLRKLLDEVESGDFLRSEVLQQWLDFVRAGPLARFLAEGVGKIAATIRNLFRTEPPPPAPPVREAAFSDLVASARRHADDAAGASSSTWSGEPLGDRALADRPDLLAAGGDFDERLRESLASWGEAIGSEIATLGQQRKAWAQAASVGLNVLGTSAMIAVFVHTGGLTGTEVGIGAATAFLNQKLLEAIFGEANVAAFVKRARSRLTELLSEAFQRDQARFAAAVGPMEKDLPATLRRLADEARAGAMTL
ncbi:MAG TPA: GTPase domain-containing protein, partial [Acidimicrobiia bacterium]|nr:GTPase domain-containing protein [Acidimicrobiia bacterium]